MFLVCSFSRSLFDFNLWLRICVATLDELVRCNRCGVSPPEIDLDDLPQDDTGKWIFEDPGYKKWQRSEKSELLCVYGGLGTGKTMLAKRVAARFLNEHRGSHGGDKFACHFVSPELPTGGPSADEAQPPQRRLAKVPWDLLYGILRRSENLFHVCKDELRYQGDNFLTNPGSLWRVLGKAIQGCEPGPVYILIDGVDRFAGSLSKELVGRILSLMTIRVVKIFLSSRDSTHILDYLPECTEIDLNSNIFVRADVNNFIRSSVGAFRRWEVVQRERAIKTLQEKSEGTFLWTSLAVEHLSSCIDFDFEDFLREFPPGLEDVYQKMVRSLPPGGPSNKVLNVIQCVALAMRPLKFGELGHLLAFMEDEAKTTQQRSPGGTVPKLQPKTEAQMVRYVQSSQSFLRKTAEHVSIVHHTAVKFLFEGTFQDGIRVPPKAELDLKAAWECFRYLHYALADPVESLNQNEGGRDDGSLGSSPERDTLGELAETPQEVSQKRQEAAVAKWPYIRYAAEYWFLHARRSINIAEQKFCDDSARSWLQYPFFDTGGTIRDQWIELCRDPKMKVLEGEQTPLHVAVCLGLKPLVEKALLDYEAGADSTSGDLLPLHLAAKFISEAYEILIASDHTSLLTALGKYGNTPLHEAAISGHSLMLQGLVKKFKELGPEIYSTQINKKNKFGDTPLHLAVRFDHLDIVDLLVKNHANCSIRNNHGVTASELGQELGRRDSVDIVEKVGKFCGTKKETAEGIAEGTAGGAVGDTEGDTVGDTVGNTVGDAVGNTQPDTEQGAELDTEPDTEGDVVGDVAEDTEGKTAGSAAGGIEEDTQEDTEGDTERDTAGDTEPDTEPDTEKGAERGSEPDTEGDVVGDVAEDTEGNTAGDTVGDTVGNTEPDTEQGAELDNEPDTEGDVVGDVAEDTEGNTAANTAEVPRRGLWRRVWRGLWECLGGCLGRCRKCARQGAWVRVSSPTTPTLGIHA
ncbi:hypothetical protein HOY80DRAFT_1097687 [Tuber brumale]|nr:hypothetical protein HOY80DRAFT_1097687 [Tuber brumale]